VSKAIGENELNWKRHSIRREKWALLNSAQERHLPVLFLTRDDNFFVLEKWSWRMVLLKRTVKIVQ